MTIEEALEAADRLFEDRMRAFYTTVLAHDGIADVDAIDEIVRECRAEYAAVRAAMAADFADGVDSVALIER